MTKRRIWLTVRFVVPVLILAAILWTTDWQKLRSLVTGADRGLLLAALVTFNAAVIIQGGRWHVLLSSDSGRWPIFRVYLLHYVAMFFDLFTPGKIAGDAYRIATMQQPGRMHHMVISLVAMRLHGLSNGILLSLIAGTFLLGERYGPMVVVPATLGVLGLLTWGTWHLYRAGSAGAARLRTRSGFWGKTGSHLEKADEAFRSIVSNRRTLVVSCILVMVYMLLIVSMYALVGRAFGMRMPFWNYLAVVPILSVVAAVPISIQGRGVIEVIALALWAGPGRSAEQIVLTCLTVAAVTWAQGVFAGVAWMCLRHGDSGGDVNPDADSNRADSLEPPEGGGMP